MLRMGPFPQLQCSEAVAVCGKWLNYRLGGQLIGLREPFFGVQVSLDCLDLLVDGLGDEEACAIDEVLNVALGPSMADSNFLTDMPDLRLY